jgi:adenylate cyclase
MEDEVAQWRSRHALTSAVDDKLEEAMRDRLPLAETLDTVMPLLAEHSGAATITLQTYGEDLELHDFAWGEPEAPGGSQVSWQLDVAGEDFGTARMSFAETLATERLDVARELLGAWCEELDNHLAAVARAREKHRITLRLSDALKSPVLGTGIDEAIAILRETVRFDDLVLAYHHEDDVAGETLSFRVLHGETVTCDSRRSDATDEDRFMAERARAFITGEQSEVLDHFAITNPQDQVLLKGLTDQRVIGRFLINDRARTLSTYDRDLLQRFADYLRQRIVDFNREYKHLSLNFPAPVVRRLLGSARYAEEFLSPRERDIAILYTDIAGFTRISEGVLASPTRIGALINTWSEGVVAILWQSGGVFDKMVGDCIIAHWGPPFFELSPKECCDRALEAAIRIRDFTKSLSHSDALPELAEAGIALGVCTGLNFCTANVGFFGPNLDYTAFSAGMNNTSRLQGVAVRDEILCMDAFVHAVDDAARFAEERTAEVKNVAAALRFRPAR